MLENTYFYKPNYNKYEVIIKLTNPYQFFDAYMSIMCSSYQTINATTNIK